MVIITPEVVEYEGGNMGVVSAIVGAAQGTAGAIFQYSEEKEQFKADKKAQSDYNLAVRGDTIDGLKDITQAKSDVLYNVGQDTLQSQVDFLEARSSSQVLANAMGLRGGSYDSIMNDLSREGSQNLSDITSSRDASIRKIRRQGEAIRKGEAGRFDTRVIRKPSAFKAFTSAILGGVSQGAQGYASGKELEKAYNGSQTTST